MTFSPGRYLATHEMKIILSMILLRYDLKFADGVKPREFFIATMAITDTNTEVLVRRRKE